MNFTSKVFFNLLRDLEMLYRDHTEIKSVFDDGQ